MKDQTFLEYKIKIRKVREAKKIGVGSYEYKDKMYLVDIKNSYGGGVGFKVDGGNLKKVFYRIMEELHLR